MGLKGTIRQDGYEHGTFVLLQSRHIKYTAIVHGYAAILEDLVAFANTMLEDPTEAADIPKYNKSAYPVSTSTPNYYPNQFFDTCINTSLLSLRKHNILAEP
jgi:hypothetical protein